MREINSRDIKKVPTLRGKTIINLFYEASTRTRTSFEIAGKRLSADTVNITTSTSSATKGETLADTALNLLAMKPDIIVMRHAVSGSHYFLSAKMPSCSIINAGDGTHEHPSQGLLDMLTMKDRFGRLDGLKVAIVGDITHSRVARSNIQGLTKIGSHVFLAGPPTMMPPGVETTGQCHGLRHHEGGDPGCRRGHDAAHPAGAPGEDPDAQYPRILPLLRPQSENLKLAKPDAMVMHPGPINRGVEMSSYVVDGGQSHILKQVENGVAVRMAMLYHVCGGELE